MNTPRKNKSGSTLDSAPIDAPQTIPASIGYGHPEYHFVESLSVVNRTLGILETKIESLKDSSDSTELKQEIRDLKSDLGKIRDDMHTSKVWILTIFGGGVLLLLSVFSGGYLLLSSNADKTTNLISSNAEKASANSEKTTALISDMRVSIQHLVDAIPPQKH